MKICLVGHHVGQPDEGVRKITRELAEELARRHDVATRSVGDPKGWPSIRDFRPDVIHFVLSPTLPGLAAAKLVSFMHRPATTVISAPHPDLRFLGKAASLFRPDLVLVQAEDSDRRFRSLGYRTQFLPNGVDTQRFVPVGRLTKARLRDKYSIEKRRFLLVHVGPLKQGRNLRLMQALQRDDNQVLVVGRASEAADSRLAHELRDSGCIVWTHFLPCVEEIYGMADCYVFPTTDRRYCIEMPLSVLEAMSCNLPVITTRFGALPRLFESSLGLTFVGADENLTEALHLVKQGAEVRTRDMVSPYSWHRVIWSLEQTYERIAATRGRPLRRHATSSSEANQSG